MNNKGFTLVELLAVIIILGLLMLLAIPSYLTIFNNIKRNNLDNKISEIQTAALKYGEQYKDYIKKNGCMTTTIGELIVNGYIDSEDSVGTYITNPVDNSKLVGTVYICYCLQDYNSYAYYTEAFSGSKKYFHGQYVVTGGKIYKTMFDTPKGGLNINSTNSSGKRYFEQINLSTRC